jgi:hypothetical protein
MTLFKLNRLKRILLGHIVALASQIRKHELVRNPAGSATKTRHHRLKAHPNVSLSTMHLTAPPRRSHWLILAIPHTTSHPL